MDGMIGARRVFAEPVAPEQRRRGQMPVLAAGAIVAAVALVVLTNPRGSVSIALAGGVGLVCLVAAVVYVHRHRDSVITAILLTEMLSSNVLMPEGVSTGIRYGLNFIFCAPLVPTLWRSGLIWQGSFRLLLLYFIWSSITITYSLTPIYSLGRLITVLLLVSAVSVLALEVSDKQDVRRLLRNYLIGCSILVALLAASYFLLPHDMTFKSPEMLDANGNPIAGTIRESTGGISRFSGIFLHPNEVGSLVLVMVAVGVAYWMSASRRTKLLLATLMTAAIILGVLSDSRSSMGAMMVGLTLFFLWRYRWRGILWVAGLTVAAAFVIMLMLGGDLRTYLDRGDVSSFTGRTDIWNYTMDQIKAAPILGYGYEVEGQIFQLRHFPIWYGPWDEGPHSSLHETYLAHMVGVGIPATLLWLFVMLRPWVALFKRDGDPWGLKPLALMIAVPYFIVGFMENEGDVGYCSGLIFMLGWALAERARMQALETAKREREIALTQMSPAAAAIASAAVTP